MENLWIPELVPLGQVDANPWQVRMEDAAHVMKVARSIAEHDLIQPGTGRRVDGRVQLAAGHMRLAAFRFLDEQFGARGNGQAGDRYAAFPVIVRELSDEQMAEYALEENLKRKDLSAIEKGRALQRYMADFGKTQTEAGERFSLTQSAVSHLLRLLDLPAPVQDLVNQGALPERFARQLVSLAQVAPKDVTKTAQMIAEMPTDERDETAVEQIDELLDEHGRSLNQRSGSYWPLDWRPESGAIPDAVACQVCPFRVVAHGKSTCTNLVCFEARKADWLQRELERVADKFKIAIAAPGEPVKALEIGYKNEGDVKALLKRKNKPDCLRLMPITDDGYSYKYSYYSDVLGSKVVALGSTDPAVLRREQEAKEARAKGVDLPADSDEARGQAAEQEKAERDERRETRSAVRRGQWDIPWLIFHTAEACGEQLQVSGAALDWMNDLVFDASHVPVGWEQYKDEQEKLADQIQAAKGKAEEVLVRRGMLVHRFADVIWIGNSNQTYDWPRALETIQQICDELDLKPGAGWNEPPIWRTETNCHACGKFTSMDHITARDGEEGWRMDGKVVTCSEECRKQVAKPQVAGKKSQAKGKKR